MEDHQPWHRLFGLSWMDFFHGLSAEERLEGLSAETLEAFLRRLKANGPSADPS
jgi:hypothetical protein